MSIDMYEADLSTELISDLKEISLRDWEEVGDKNFSLNVDWDIVFSLYQSGTLKIFIISEGDTIIGYAFYTVNGDILCKDIIVASQLVLFIDSPYRKSLKSYGVRFIKFCEERLRIMGVSKINFITTLKHNNTKLLTRLGYNLVEEVYEKRLV